ncbi:HNH endonuclease [Alkalihalobacillus macyae]|uniref:HNH endonuclease n=1 Tax=Guptibacillus hwajinpoensis TaxID=208199 RepID=UPI00273BC785|nr:HNH endonuclease [Alkalihalobacillus macyae]MDP4549822.1 HNH endonuclease [Alkalihalobacillus macyae]
MNSKNESAILTPIPGNFSNYLCDVENGRIWNKKTEKFLAVNPNKTYGYVYVNIRSDDGKWVSKGLHVWVMASHFGSFNWKELGLEVNHINRHEKWNNGIHNLELTTRKEQYNCPELRRDMGKGKRLIADEVKLIREAFATYEGKVSAFCNYLAYEVFGCHYITIKNIVDGKTWKKI